MTNNITEEKIGPHSIINTQGKEIGILFEKELKVLLDILSKTPTPLLQETYGSQKELLSQSHILSIADDSSSFVFAINRFSNNFLTQTTFNGDYQPQMQVINPSDDALDTLCAAWIAWRISRIKDSEFETESEDTILNK